MTPEQKTRKAHRAQRRLNAGERIIKEQIADNDELAEELGVPQPRKDAIRAKGQAVKDALKEYHDELAGGCGDIGVQPLAGDDKDDPPGGGG